MNPQKWVRIQEVFHAAADMSRGERVRFLESACDGDHEVRREVELLLASEDGGNTRKLEHAIAAVAQDADSNQAPAEGERIGPYAIIRPLASGGMGTVFLAARADQQFQKQVAIKLIRSGFTHQELLMRFRAERQILANLQHPNIAHLLDGGVTQTGFPYLVMEFIDGMPIDVYCRERNLSLDARLELFQTVCAAVQFAHQNLVIHRDIKPANILVTAEGAPKLLDFGIAKLVKPEAMGHTVAVTTAAERLMTPEYASPEQIMGGLITTATDVYALGVLLYQLLSGSQPFQLQTGSVLEMERVVCHQDPPPPSSMPGAAPAVKGDLDNIVMMAMRKEPARRYASVADFADDIRRYREGYPVLARKDTWRYRSGKFIRRHKIGVAAAAVFLTVILGLAIGMTVLAARASKERDEAEQQRKTAQQVTAFMADLFKLADPETARGNTITAREVLDHASEKIDEDLRDQPAVRAELLSTIGKVYENLGLWDKSRALLEQAVSVRRGVNGSESLPVAQALKDVAELARRKRDFAAAEAMARESLAIRRKLLGERHADVAESLNTLALVLHQKSDLDAAVPLFLQALSMRELLDAKPHLETAILSNLGGVLKDRGDLAGAERYLRECMEIRRKTLTGAHPRIALAAYKLGGVLEAEGKSAEAETLYREALAIREKAFPAVHPDTASSLEALARLLAATKREEEAAPLRKRAEELRKKLAAR